MFTEFFRPADSMTKRVTETTFVAFGLNHNSPAYIVGVGYSFRLDGLFRQSPPRQSLLSHSNCRLRHICGGGSPSSRKAAAPSRWRCSKCGLIMCEQSKRDAKSWPACGDDRCMPASASKISDGNRPACFVSRPGSHVRSHAHIPAIRSNMKPQRSPPHRSRAERRCATYEPPQKRLVQ